MESGQDQFVHCLSKSNALRGGETSMKLCLGTFSSSQRTNVTTAAHVVVPQKGLLFYLQASSYTFTVLCSFPMTVRIFLF